MNVFLPFKNFRKCAECLSTKDLIQQRMNIECLLKLFLKNLDKYDFIDEELSGISIKMKEHPIYKLWWNNGKPFCPALLKYWECANWELFNRNEDKHNISSIIQIIKENSNLFPSGAPPMPRRITTGYRIILLAMDARYYRIKFYKTFKDHNITINFLKRNKEQYKYSKFIGITQ